MSTLFEHRTTTLPLITSRFVNETFPGWSRMMEACIDMLADHGGAMDALGVYCGIETFPLTTRSCVGKCHFCKNTTGESRMFRRTRLLAAWQACRGRSWASVWRREAQRAERNSPLRIAHFNCHVVDLSYGNMMQESTNTLIILCDYLLYRHKLRHATTRIACATMFPARQQHYSKTVLYIGHKRSCRLCSYSPITPDRSWDDGIKL
jgi:hypothetical protein